MELDFLITKVTQLVEKQEQKEKEESKRRARERKVERREKRIEDRRLVKERMTKVMTDFLVQAWPKDLQYSTGLNN